jgi:cell division protein FtsL
VTKVNLLLLVALLVSAFSLVNVRYESRRVYMDLSKARSQALRLEADNEQLQAQKRAQAAPIRIQQIAAGQLQMRPTNPAVTEYVQLGAAAQGKGQP